MLRSRQSGAGLDIFKTFFAAQLIERTGSTREISYTELFYHVRMDQLYLTQLSFVFLHGSQART